MFIGLKERPFGPGPNEEYVQISDGEMGALIEEFPIVGYFSGAESDTEF